MKRLKYAKNKQELRAYIQQEFTEVFDDVVDKMLVRLDEIIVRDVYTYDYYPNIRYWGLTKFDAEEGNGITGAKPTFQFRRAWKKDNASTTETPSVGIKFDQSEIGSEHNSIIKRTSMAPFIAEILNVDGYTSELQFGIPPGTRSSTDPGSLRHVSKIRQPYWDNFVKEMRRGRVRKWLKEAALAKGLDVK